MIVYKITNTINSKIYFGITKHSISKRWNEHKCKSKSGSSHLYKAMRKYGLDKFSIDVIKECETDEAMYSLEVYYIKKYKTNNPHFGYNNSEGGEISSKGKTLSEETKNKISLYQRTRNRKPHKEETKRKMSLSAKGREMSKAVLISAELRRGKPAKNRVKVILNDSIIFNSITEASLETGVLTTSISNNINGLSKKTKVGIWKIYQDN